MPSQNGGIDTELIAALFASPQRFRFVQAVRLLLDWLAEQGVPSERALVDCLRFDNSVSLGFPASQIEALSLDVSGASPRVHLTPTFMGFLGSHGVLPNHYSERIACWQHRVRDDGPRAFLDLFSTRVLALFYLGWRKYRIEQTFSDAPPSSTSATAPLPLLLALAGRRRAEARNISHARGEDGSDAGVDDEAIAFYAGLLQHRQLSSVLLGRILGGYFGLPCRVEESTGGMEALAPAEQTALGRAHAALGQRAMLGPRSHRPDLRARLRIGPLDRQAFQRFLPGGRGAAAISQMLTLFAAPAIGYDIRLVLAKGELDGIRLASAPSGAASRLGWDSFLLDGSNAAPRSDVAYEVVTMQPFPDE